MSEKKLRKYAISTILIAKGLLNCTVNAFTATQNLFCINTARRFHSYATELQKKAHHAKKRNFEKSLSSRSNDYIYNFRHLFCCFCYAQTFRSILVLVLYSIFWLNVFFFFFCASSYSRVPVLMFSLLVCVFCIMSISFAPRVFQYVRSTLFSIV